VRKQKQDIKFVTAKSMSAAPKTSAAPKDQSATGLPNAVSTLDQLADYHSTGSIEKSKQWAVDFGLGTIETEVVMDRLPEKPGRGPNLASGTGAEQCDRRAPPCPEFPSVSTFDIHPDASIPDFAEDVAGCLSDASIPDFEDVAEEFGTAGPKRFHNDIHRARGNRSSDSDAGSFHVNPVRIVHPTRLKSLPSQTVTVTVSKMRSFYSVETNIESPIEYEDFQAPSNEERGMRAAFKLEACVMEGIDKFCFRNRASTRILLSSDVNTSCGKVIEQEIACDRPRVVYNAVLGSGRNLQMAVHKLKAMQEIQGSTASTARLNIVGNSDLIAPINALIAP
jgi:hypothetical protein